MQAGRRRLVRLVDIDYNGLVALDPGLRDRSVTSCSAVAASMMVIRSHLRVLPLALD